MTNQSPNETPKKSDRFPRSSDLPVQTPQYWAKEKDRYIRQLLIKDIEAVTGRPLFVFFSQLSQQIDHSDPDDIAEVLYGLKSRSADFFIQTPGGNVDATEKIIKVLGAALDDYRVIVPSWAKSAGTVIALSAKKILLGLNSELGPIDPHWNLGQGPIPCELIARDPAPAQHIRELADLACKRMKALAKDVLKKGMMSGSDDTAIDSVISKISSATSYMSHGAVIDYSEAKALGLEVEYLEPDSVLWKSLWLLYCLYDYDTKAKNIGKVFEGNIYSLSRQS